MKKLKKSDKRILLGVCGGIAEYFKADPTLVRLIVIIFAVLSSIIPVAIIYICAAIIMPDNDDIELDAEDVKISDDEQNAGTGSGTGNETETGTESGTETESGTGTESGTETDTETGTDGNSSERPKNSSSRNKKSGKSKNETHRSDQEFNSYFEK